VAMNQADELRRRGHDVHIAAGWDGDRAPPTRLHTLSAHLFPVRQLVPRTGFSGLFSARLALWLWLNIGSFDLAHIHAGRDLITSAALQIAQLRRVPYVTQTHGMIGRDERPVAGAMDALLTRRLLNGALRRFVLTEKEAEDFRTLLGHDMEVERLLNGVPMQAEPVASKSDSGVPPDVLYVARLQRRKRPVAFAEMASILCERNVDAKYSVVGPDEGALKDLRAAVRRLGIEDRLTYEGALHYEQVVDRMARADIYVLPSIDEPFPMSLLEALSIGLPSVCTTSCGIADVLQRYHAAVVCDPAPISLADAVQELLIDSEVRQRLSRDGRQVVSTIFSIGAVGDQLERCYTTVMSHRQIQG
jgi:glycosyltransferase involved in cell wall biosynthesis